MHIQGKAKGWGRAVLLESGDLWTLVCWAGGGGGVRGGMRGPDQYIRMDYRSYEAPFEMGLRKCRGPGLQSFIWGKR